MNIAKPVAEFLLKNGATIECVTEARHIGESREGYPHNTGRTASGLEVSLDCHLFSTFQGEGWIDQWSVDAPEMIQRVFAKVIRARVQATLVPAAHVTRQIAKLDSVDQDGNMVKVRLNHGVNPVNHVIRIGDEVYGVIMAKELPKRHRLHLDRPLDGDYLKGAPIYGCTVPNGLARFDGVTIVSEPLADIPDRNNIHEREHGLNARISSYSSRWDIEMICGLSVDPSKATLR